MWHANLHVISTFIYVYKGTVQKLVLSISRPYIKLLQRNHAFLEEGWTKLSRSRTLFSAQQNLTELSNGKPWTLVTYLFPAANKTVLLSTPFLVVSISSLTKRHMQETRLHKAATGFREASDDWALSNKDHSASKKNSQQGGHPPTQQ